MKEILKSNLNNARNGEHFQFHADVLSVLTAEVAQAQNIAALRTTYASLFADEDTAFIQSQAYESTKKVEEKDNVRDNLFLYIKQTIESDLPCPLAEKKAAAVKLDFALNPYRSANSRPYAENTAQITNFVGDMQSAEYAIFVSKLGLTEAIEVPFSQREFKKKLRILRTMLQTPCSSRLEARRMTRKSYAHPTHPTHLPLLSANHYFSFSGNVYFGAHKESFLTMS